MSVSNWFGDEHATALGDALREAKRDGRGVTLHDDACKVDRRERGCTCTPMTLVPGAEA